MSVVYTHALNNYEDVARKNTEMESKIGNSQQHCHPNNPGLSRYSSAPSSLLTSLVDTRIGFLNEETFRNYNHNQHYAPTTSSEMETMMTNSEPLYELEEKQVKHEEKDPFSQRLQYNGYSYESSNQIIYQPQMSQGLQNGSLALENYAQTKVGFSNNCSNLIRQKSSPAEFFSNYSVDNGMHF